MKPITSLSLILAVALIVLPFATVLAGPGGLGGAPDGAPIDGGISLLVAAGIGYGAKKARNARKKTRQKEENSGCDL